MNVLCIYPGMARQQDNAYMLVRLKDKGVKLAVIAGRSLGLKGSGQLPRREDIDGVPVYRLFRNPLDILLFPRRELKEILTIATELKPDLIFCSQQLNIRLSVLLKKYLNVPIVLLVEEAGRLSTLGSGEGRVTRLIMHCLGIPTGLDFWPWLNEEASALITCDPADKQVLDKLSTHGKPVFYIPWPTHVPDDFNAPSSRDKSRAVYVGSLYPFKNTQEFERTLPQIVRETPTKKFVVVGPGPHAKMIKRLEKETNGAIRYVQQLPRTEALALIAGSFYGYTPVERGGWGFIGDCWSMKTPVVMTHAGNYVADNVNALVCKNEDELIQRINSLYAQPDLFSKLQTEGYKESTTRSARVVADSLFNVFLKALEA